MMQQLATCIIYTYAVGLKFIAARGGLPYNVLHSSYYSFCKSKDFRPAYGKINEIRAFAPSGVPLIACTATVTKSVRQEKLGDECM